MNSAFIPQWDRINIAFFMMLVLTALNALKITILKATAVLLLTHLAYLLIIILRVVLTVKVEKVWYGDNVFDLNIIIICSNLKLLQNI
jgi:hypothetical protein